MLYDAHPEFDTPDDAVRLWRYLDFTKYVSLLENKALFFSRIDQLDDPFEYATPEPDIAKMKEALAKVRNEHLTASQMFHGHMRAREYLKYMLFVNSWHMNDYESAAMWRVFLKSDEGVAVSTTIRDMKAALQPAKPSIMIGKMEYIDYSKHSIPNHNALVPCLRKRLSFSYEQEVRLLMLHVSDAIRQGSSLEGVPLGQFVDVDLNRLIQCVHVAPTAPAWFRLLVERVTATYGFEFRVQSSSLGERPLY